MQINIFSGKWVKYGDNWEYGDNTKKGFKKLRSPCSHGEVACLHKWIQTKATARKRSIQVKIGDFFVPCDLEIWWMTLKNNRAPLLCYFQLCASFCSHWCIKTGVTVRNRPILVKIDNFFSRVTLKFDRWPWKTIGHLFYATSSFVHHFITTCEFKLELRSGNG